VDINPKDYSEIKRFKGVDLLGVDGDNLQVFIDFESTYNYTFLSGIGHPARILDAGKITVVVILFVLATVGFAGVGAFAGEYDHCKSD
jgi:hypothetical protein